MVDDAYKPLPFLKWAGGKRWLTERHSHLFEVDYDRFIEPFVGSGAVFFWLQPRRAILSDMNGSLIEAYQAIKDDFRKVERYLKEHHRSHSTAYYYSVRGRKFRSAAARAAKLIYLNRTCWNGLYRVNREGEFNVPIGTKSNAVLASDDFQAVAAALSRTVLRACDFEKTLSRAGLGDFVFIDPPYTVKHNNNGFIKYNQGLFSWEDQIRLRDCVASALDRGARVLVTNAYHPSLRRLYSGLGRISRLERQSVLAGKAVHRGTYSEMVIQCY